MNAFRQSAMAWVKTGDLNYLNFGGMTMDDRIWGLCKFRDLPIGSKFIFESETRYYGMARGPWIKDSSRKYHREHDGMDCRVGSINVEVIRQS